jgi:transcriptional regulator with XRE-family HTH domain
MKPHEKLERLTRLMKQKQVSQAAGLGVTTLTNILRRKSSLAWKTAVSIARVLGVDPAWLMDESKGWPPVRVEELEESHAA